MSKGTGRDTNRQAFYAEPEACELKLHTGFMRGPAWNCRRCRLVKLAGMEEGTHSWDHDFQALILGPVIWSGVQWMEILKSKDSLGCMDLQIWRRQ